MADAIRIGVTAVPPHTRGVCAAPGITTAISLGGPPLRGVPDWVTAPPVDLLQAETENRNSNGTRMEEIRAIVPAHTHFVDENLSKENAVLWTQTQAGSRSQLDSPTLTVAVS